MNLIRLIFATQVATVLFFVQVASADKLFYDETILIDDPKNVAIDFSTAIPGPDGTVCVQRKKYVDKKEKVRNIPFKRIPYDKAESDVSTMLDGSTYPR